MESFANVVYSVLDRFERNDFHILVHSTSKKGEPTEKWSSRNPKGTKIKFFKTCKTICFKFNSFVLSKVI